VAKRRKATSSKRREVLIEARGRWPGLLAALGLEEATLSGKHGACPIPGCGGKDRFRFDDKEGRGTYFCTHCGAGDGIKLVMLMKGLEFKHALKLVEELLPLAPEVKRAKERTLRQKAAALRSMWDRATPAVAGGLVSTYLHGRAIYALSEALREAVVPYYEDGKSMGEHGAMIARIQAVDGKGASLHVTYLRGDGQGKADVRDKKKVMQPVRPILGAAVQLFEIVEGTLGVAEGIETALSAFEMYGVPTWATISADGMAAFVWPETVKRLVIFADHDLNYAGQKAAYALAFRAACKGLSVEVKTPPERPADWNDILIEQRLDTRRAA
jgi:putative DNA primase/helicase